VLSFSLRRVALLFALVNVTSAEWSPPSPPSTPPGYLQIDYPTGYYYMDDNPLSAASVHATAAAEGSQSNQPALLSLNASSHARRLAVVTCPSGYYDSTNGHAKNWACGCANSNAEYACSLRRGQHGGSFDVRV
jgi:hypothetical protein